MAGMAVTLYCLAILHFHPFNEETLIQLSPSLMTAPSQRSFLLSKDTLIISKPLGWYSS